MEQLKPKSYWNTRVVFDFNLNQIGFKEVHYKNDKITSWTMDFVNPRKILKLHLKSALSKPILQQKKRLKEVTI